MGPLGDDEEDAEAAEHGKGGARRGGAKLAGLICARDKTKREAAVARSTAMKRPAAAPKPAAARKSILKRPAALAPGGAGWLPKGWKVWKPYAGRSDKYYRSPCGTEMRSMAEVRRRGRGIDASALQLSVHEVAGRSRASIELTTSGRS